MKLSDRARTLLDELCRTTGRTKSEIIEDALEMYRPPRATREDRARTALQLRKTGLSYREVGERLGVGPEQADNLCRKGKRLEEFEIQRAHLRGADREKILDASVDVLDTTVAVANVLCNANCQTIRDVLRRWNDLPTMKNFGRRGAQSLRKALREFGIDPDGATER